jgi:hypothetical protein
MLAPASVERPLQAGFANRDMASHVRGKLCRGENEGMKRITVNVSYQS